jgi:hypothetical protein
MASEKGQPRKRARTTKDQQATDFGILGMAES